MGKMAFFCILGIIIISIMGCGGNDEGETNTAPKIISFQTNTASVKVNDQVTLIVSAVDAENNQLTYDYNASAGTIILVDNKATWIAPSTPGEYEISVSVGDGKLTTKSSIKITVSAEQPTKKIELKIQWFGQSCFLITSTDGKRILTDPFSSGIGYAVPSLEADVVTVSHSHSDHNNVSMAKGSPQIIKTLGQTTSDGITFNGIDSDHDDSGGSKRGKNIIFVWDIDGMRFVHLGDLGTLLTDSQLKSMGKVDILFIPVGGYYTIDGNQATKVVDQLSPKLVFPMHYKTDVTNLPISNADEFLKGKDNVEKVNGNITAIKELPEKTKIIVLNYK
jgi:L-ascorbate metabolism protein UlaG (beta-lactamase superfamily)